MLENKTFKLFCDGSINPQKKLGFAAYFIYEKNLDKQNIKIKRFEETSSTKLEIEALLWALEDKRISPNKKIKVYTDCQNILKLLDRKQRLEENNFFTKNKKLIKNHTLYKEFYRLNEILDLEFIKVKGHKKTILKDEIDTLFTLVDKASRKALRNFNIKEEI